MSEQRTQFDYLLNALELAGQADKPAEHGYRDKRLALFAYVRQLEAVAQQAGNEQRYLDAIRWALGCGDDFQPRQPGQGAYYWRAGLVGRAGLVWDGDEYQPAAEDSRKERAAGQGEA